MPFTWSIRRKSFFGAVLVLTMVGMLSAVSLYVVYSYREFVRICNSKLNELAHATDLRTSTINLFESTVGFAESDEPVDVLLEKLSVHAVQVRSTLDGYRRQLGANVSQGIRVPSRSLLKDVDRLLSKLQKQIAIGFENPNSIDRADLRSIAGTLSQGLGDLPITIATEFDEIVDSSRSAYRNSFYLVVFSSLVALGLTVSLAWFFYRAVFRPIRVLHRGSRRVARGNFNYRIQLETDDEMAELALLFPGIRNYNIAVREWEDEIIFLRKIIDGSADKSYGIHVARLAGMPDEVIQRARVILANLEAETLDVDGKPKFATIKSKEEDKPKQLALFNPPQNVVIEEIRNLDTSKITPLEALNKLHKLKEKLEEKLEE